MNPEKSYSFGFIPKFFNVASVDTCGLIVVVLFEVVLLLDVVLFTVVLFDVVLLFVVLFELLLASATFILIVFDPVTSCSDVSATSDAVIVIVAVPAFFAVTV